MRKRVRKYAKRARKTFKPRRKIGRVRRLRKYGNSRGGIRL